MTFSLNLFKGVYTKLVLAQDFNLVFVDATSPLILILVIELKVLTDPHKFALTD